MRIRQGALFLLVLAHALPLSFGGGFFSQDQVEEAKAMASFFNKVPSASPESISFLKNTMASSDKGPKTLFIPLSGGVLSKDRLTYGKDKFRRILKFHIVPGYKYRVTDLQVMPEDTKLVTAEGSSMKKFSKVNASVLLLQGRVFLPAAVVVPNLYVGKSMAIHAISTRLLPTSF
eukprot:TRINITY_DN60948_c0_g1_i2.p1 TRINITY_DN60948_c0_g1~~TRINITY_DN60948_c0_g1_i2.p1  ORF type:complete len:175 (+),score=14.08 TRINITY_DN60948_c0_g1_i2:338-862(+)